MMTSGYVANEGLLSAIVDEGDWVASDAYNHASIVDGLRLELSPDEEKGLAQPATVNAEAYEEYLRGRDRFAR